MPLYEPPTRPRRLLNLALFTASISWVFAATEIAARSARGLATRFQWNDEFLLLDGVCLLFLLTAGFALLESIARRGTSFRQLAGLPRRRSSGAEWATGAAVAWSVVLVSVLTMALAKMLHVRLWFDSRAVWLGILNLAAAALFSLAFELAFRGFPYRRLIDAVGPTGATIAISFLYGVVATFGAASSLIAFFVAVSSSLLLCSAWLRTHGLWLGWGAHFAWIASLGILFGLPVNGFDDLSSVVQSRAVGRTWLTGGDSGPEAALLTVPLLLLATFLLFRLTRDWAWQYTHPAIIAAGFPMEVPPPAVHAEMENKAPSPSALVQILPNTSQSRSAQTGPM